MGHLGSYADFTFYFTLFLSGCAQFLLVNFSGHEIRIVVVVVVVVAAFYHPIHLVQYYDSKLR